MLLLGLVVVPMLLIGLGAVLMLLLGLVVVLMLLIEVGGLGVQDQQEYGCPRMFEVLATHLLLS